MPDTPAPTRRDQPGPGPAERLYELWRQGRRPDVDGFLADAGPLPLAELAEVLREDQRQRWRLGERVGAEDYLRCHPALGAEPSVAVDLAYAEYLLRERLGERPEPGEYLLRFPEHAETLAAQIELHRALAASQGTPTRPDGAAPPAAPARPDVPGYEVLGELGRGGMGVVYKARHLKLDRVVALKMILSGGHAGESELARFQREAEAIARLSHPNVVQVYEVGEHEGKPFFSLEFCEGGSLEARLAGTPLPPREAAALVGTLARATHAAHQASVIHRDLKPANVLLVPGPDGVSTPREGSPLSGLVPKVTDFGLAKKLDEAGHTHTGAVVGTPSYVAPEQARGKKDVGPAADVYALGAILYECLTGRPPFKGATAMDTLMQVLENEPVPPRRLNPKVPLDLETVCLKCLHKEPARRYDSAAELADDLVRFLAAEPIRARPVGALERGVKWVRRNAVVSALAACVMLALTAGVAVSGWFAHDAGQEATRARGAEKEARDMKGDAERESAEAMKARAEAERDAKEAKAQTRRADDERARAEEQLRRAEWLVYAGKLSLSQSDFEAGNGALALRYLDECQWDLRGWEHRHLWTRFDSKLTLKGHTDLDGVNSVAFSPDGRRVLTGSDDWTAKVWDAQKGAEVLTLRGHTQTVNSVAFSPDGKRIFAWDVLNEVRAWSVADGKPVEPRDPPPMPPPGSALSPDGRLVAKPDGLTVVVLDLLRPPPTGDPWPLPDRGERMWYHGEQAVLTEKARQHFALAFHLGRLLLDDPDNADLKKRRDDALKRHADQTPQDAPHKDRER